jgi:hypothetical protein
MGDARGGALAEALREGPPLEWTAENRTNLRLVVHGRGATLHLPPLGRETMKAEKYERFDF